MPLGVLTQRDKAFQLEKQKQRTKGLRRWLVLVGGIGIAAVIAGVFALQNAKLAEVQRLKAVQNRNKAEDILQYLLGGLRIKLESEASLAVLRRMADSLMLKVRETGKAIRTITIRARYRHMDEEQRSESLPEPSDLEIDIYPRLRPLLDQAWKRREGLRLVGLRLSNVHENLRQEELALFGTATSSTAQRALARVVDDLRRNFGHDAIMRGHDLTLRDKSR